MTIIATRGLILAASLGIFATSVLSQGDKVLELGTPGPVPHPATNPYSKAKAELGEKLFFEGKLSKTGETPCTWCHEPGRGWSDGRIVSLGDPRTSLNRHTPSLLNVGYAQVLFWDGRSSTLEEQALFPLQHPQEMNIDLKTVPKVLANAGYAEDFQKAFGTKEITVDRVAKALATFQRTLIENDTPYDRWLKGNKTAMSETALKGLELFKGKAGCVTCHSGPNFTKATLPNTVPYENTGVFQTPVLDPDDGRMSVLKANDPEAPKFAKAFKVPSLRGVGKTRPYMHNGSLATLRDVIDFYDRGGDEGRLKKLGLTEDEKKALVAFLRDGITQKDED